MMIGLVIGSQGLFMLGVVLFSAVVAFQLVTLPVEFDASARAKRLAFDYGLVLEQERGGMAKVLNAAALTYVAAAVSSLMTLLYFLFRAGLLGGGNRD
jgi:Zn-dependent membrane protease YugP